MNTTLNSGNPPYQLPPIGLLAGARVIITGGGTGLGEQIAASMGRQGARVVIASRSLEHLASAGHKLRQLGYDVISKSTDITDPTQVAALFQFAVEQFGGVDILVNNAAGNFAWPSDQLRPNQVKRITEIVQYGSLFCSQEAIRQMRQQGRGGCILSIVANYHDTGAPLMLASAMAKAAVANMTRTLGSEFGEFGIRVNAFAPGTMVTEGASKNLGFDTPTAQERIRNAVPLGSRLTSPEEMAEIAMLLCSPLFRYTTGQVIESDGGAMLGRGLLDIYPRQGIPGGKLPPR